MGDDTQSRLKHHAGNRVVECFIITRHNTMFAVPLVLIGLWIPAAINLSGVKKWDRSEWGLRLVLELTCEGDV